MAQAIGHFAFGMAARYALVYVTSLYRRFDGVWLLGVFGELWAMLPDVYWVLPIGGGYHQSPLMTIFWFHHQLDAVATRHNSHQLTVIFVAVMLLSASGLWLSERRAGRTVEDEQ